MSKIRVHNDGMGGYYVEEIYTVETAFERPEDDVEPFQPAVVTLVEYDDLQVVSHEMDFRGRSESRVEGREQADITVEGILVENQLDEAKSLLRDPDNQIITVVNDLYQGPIVVNRVTINQDPNLVEFIPDGDNPELAFTFQLQGTTPNWAVAE